MDTADNQSPAKATGANDTVGVGTLHPAVRAGAVFALVAALAAVILLAPSA